MCFVSGAFLSVTLRKPFSFSFVHICVNLFRNEMSSNMKPAINNRIIIIAANMWEIFTPFKQLSYELQTLELNKLVSTQA